MREEKIFVAFTTIHNPEIIQAKETWRSISKVAAAGSLGVLVVDTGKHKMNDKGIAAILPLLSGQRQSR